MPLKLYPNQPVGLCSEGGRCKDFRLNVCNMCINTPRTFSPDYMQNRLLDRLANHNIACFPAVPGVPYKVSVAAVNSAGRGVWNITRGVVFTMELSECW